MNANDQLIVTTDVDMDQYRMLFEHTLNGVAFCQIILDEHEQPIDFLYLKVNPAFEVSTGLSGVEGKRVTEVIPDIQKTNADLFQIYGRVAKTGITEKFDVHIQVLSRWFRVFVYGFKKEYFVAVFDNITEQKLNEEALNSQAKSLQLFRLAIENADNHIVITDPEGIIVFANHGAEQTTGFTREEMLGKTPRLWGCQMDKAFYEKFWQRIKEEKLPFVGEIKNKQKNGQLYWVLATVSPILTEDVLTGFIGVERDITAQKLATQELERRMNDATKFNDLTVGRELKMAELKKENEVLREKLGKNNV